jgi:hypothetical protein
MNTLMSTLDDHKADMSDQAYNELCKGVKRAYDETEKPLFTVMYRHNTLTAHHHDEDDNVDNQIMVSGMTHTMIATGVTNYTGASGFLEGNISVNSTGKPQFSVGHQWTSYCGDMTPDDSTRTIQLYTLLEIKPYNVKRKRSDSDAKLNEQVQVLQSDKSDLERQLAAKQAHLEFLEEQLE